MRQYVFAAAAVLIAWPAAAQWHYQGEESAFGAGGTHIALTAAGEYGFGLRCQNGELDFVYITPEDFTAEQAVTANLAGLSFLLRVDDLDPHTIAGEVDSANGKLRVSATADPVAAAQIRDAKSRIAVALSAGDELFHEAKFSVRGSTKAVGSTMKGCGAE